MVILLVSAWALGTLIVGCEKASPPATTPPVTISPSSVSLTASTPSATLFDATGGDGIYTWTLSNNGLGSVVNQNDNTEATYQSHAVVGTNTLTVTDSTGLSAAATITQE